MNTSRIPVPVDLLDVLRTIDSKKEIDIDNANKLINSMFTHDKICIRLHYKSEDELEGGVRFRYRSRYLLGGIMCFVLGAVSMTTLTALFLVV